MFFLPVPSQPRYHKRIKAFENVGYNNLIFSFERDYFKGGKSNVSYTSLGKIDHGKYVNRILKYFKAFTVVMAFKKEIKDSEIIYVFGLDLAIFVIIFTNLFKVKSKIVYEVGDIRSIMIGRKIKNKVMRFLERKVISKVEFVTVTSPYFVEEYYSNIQKIKSSKCFVLENKLYDSSTKSVSRESLELTETLTIGLFGVIRCQQSWEILCKLAESFPSKIKIYIRGYILGISNFEEKISELANMNYEGEYTSPHDLADIYSKIDICWIANVSDNKLNTKLALPNRLYESLYYRVPMVAHVESGAAKRIAELEAGWVLDFYNIKHCIEKIMAINAQEYSIKKRNTLVPKEKIIGNDDHSILINKLKVGHI